MSVRGSVLSPEHEYMISACSFVKGSDQGRQMFLGWSGDFSRFTDRSIFVVPVIFILEGVGKVFLDVKDAPSEACVSCML